jgi:hypothetical protein
VLIQIVVIRIAGAERFAHYLSGLAMTRAVVADRKVLLMPLILDTRRWVTFHYACKCLMLIPMARVCLRSSSRSFKSGT